VRARVEITVDGGSLGLITPLLDLDVEDWTIRLRPLAELVYAAHPEAVWRAFLIPDETSDKEALVGYR
jgi:hypothetical protein